MANAGLLAWGNSIRYLMANDSGRDALQEQINTNFMFLDNYLDSILARPKEDMLIDLVKTPSRRKVKNLSPTKARNPSPSKLRTLITLENDEEKENSTPINSFQKALIQAKEKAESQPTPAPSLPEQSETYGEVAVSISIHEAPSTQDGQRGEQHHPMEILEHAPLELSMIAEDEEPAERSRLSPYPSSLALAQPRLEEDRSTKASTEVEIIPVQPSTSNHPVHNADDTMSSMDTFHSIPLESPIVPSPVLDADGESSRPSVVQETKGVTEQPIVEEDAPMSETNEIADQETQIDDNPTSTLPLVPSLPAPSPFRKSVRIPREASVEPGPLGAATPGAAIAKRTSWLMKSREVKALETGNKHSNASSSTPPLSAPGVPVSAKRKSGEMLGSTVPGLGRQDDGERATKVAKHADGEGSKVVEKDKTLSRTELVREREGKETAEPPTGEQMGMLDQFKKTVEGLGARFGKSTGKSLGGGLKLNALAEARAAAEAKVAERNRQDGDTMQVDVVEVSSSGPTDEAIKADAPPETPSDQPTSAPAPAPDLKAVSSTNAEPQPVSQSSQSRMSLSDLGPTDVPKESKEERKNLFSLFPPEHENKLLSQPKPAPSSTAPSSPFTKLFNKATPVFVPPSPPATTSKPPQVASPPFTFSKPPSMSVGLSPRLPVSPPIPQQKRPPLSAQSTLESIKSDASDRVFSQEGAAWLPSSQDTEYSPAYDTQPQQRLNQSDEDDSWPIDGKLGDKIKQWPFGMTLNHDRDSLTWSSAPTETQNLNTGMTKSMKEMDITEDTKEYNQTVPGSFSMDVDEEDVDDEVEEADLASLDIGKSTVSLVEKTRDLPPAPPVPQPESQSQPSQGFFGHATKLVNSVLGKKPKTEVKSLQLAAAAAKRQQEEKDKKAAVLKNMESRRQLVLQKKLEEEKTRQLEQERKIKEELERRKREREEHTGKIPVKPAKKDEDLTGKRKIEPKKPGGPSSSGLNSSTSSKPTFKPTLKSTNPPVSSVPVAGPSNLAKAPGSMSKMKMTGPPKAADDDFEQPSQLIQSQMTARAKAQLQAAKQTEPVIPSESIELPDINSEYSDSDDEDRKNAFDPPEWAQSPDLKQALHVQSTINPDEIFGPIQPLRMEEIFKNGRTSRFRPRSSSANWTGADKLTEEELNEYKRKMGFE